LLLHAQLRLDAWNNAYVVASNLFSMGLCKVQSNGTPAWTALAPSGTASAMEFGSDNSIYVAGGQVAKWTQAASACVVQGGIVSTAAPTTALCVGDGFPDFIQLSVIGQQGTGRFGLVRQSDLGVVAVNNSRLFNMENYPAGAYFAGFLAVENLSQLNGITHVSELEGYFALSNQIAVTSQLLSGGLLAANGSAEVCSGSLSFGVSGQSGPLFRYILLNQDAKQVIAQHTNGIFDFSALPVGTYKVAHIAYTGSVNLGAISPPSIPPCMAVSNLATVERVPCGMVMNVSPNPAPDQVYITFSSAVETTAKLEVYDLAGRLIVQLYSGSMAGQQAHRYEWSGEGLPGGLYLCRLTTPTESITERILLVR
jgi:hypothetical protein